MIEGRTRIRVDGHKVEVSKGWKDWNSRQPPLQLSGHICDSLQHFLQMPYIPMRVANSQTDKAD
eukprot:scaffold338314_cov46-Prasinocladus_malaysianus.AAC.1